jgi:alkanesulfonate monooxygenase SsuD/methylene tetrahydromethanopterin reductase-like flavin-dependent oxidoreductase (luciferase family)
MQVNPAPTKPVPVIVGGDSAPALRRTAALGDGWVAPRVLAPDAAMAQIDSVKEALAAEGRTIDGFRIFATVAAQPEPDLIRRFEDAGVTDWICAPWMVAAQGDDRGYNSTIERKIELMEQFADQVIGKAA